MKSIHGVSLLVTALAGLYAAPALAERTTLKVQNRTGGTVCYVYVSACSESSWGEDVLEQDVLADGQDANVRLETGCWDLKAEDCDHAEVATRSGLEIAGPTSWTLGQAARPTAVVEREPETVRVTVRNRSGQEACYVYVSACSETGWGPDILDEDTLPDGQNARVRVQAGCWDFRAETCSHEEIATQTGVQVNANTTWDIRGAAPAASTEPVRVTIRNQSDEEVCFIYVSPCSETSWGSDILEEDTLPVGRTTRVRVRPGCFDFRAEDCAREEIETHTGITVDANTTWTIE